MTSSELSTVREPEITTCPIRQHTGDGAYVGRCDTAAYDGVCLRHGAIEDYPNLDDRDIAASARRFTPRHRSLRHCWLRARPHRWSSRWLNGERVGYDGISVMHGCTECGRNPR